MEVIDPRGQSYNVIQAKHWYLVPGNIQLRSNSFRVDRHGLSYVTDNESTRYYLPVYKKISAPCQLRLQFQKAWTANLWLSKIIIDDLFTSSTHSMVDEEGLLRVQTTIGDIFSKYYGTEVGTHITQLFTSFIHHQLNVLTLISKGLPYPDALHAWRDSSMQLAGYLHKLGFNPGITQFILHQYINQTVAQAVARSAGNYQAQIEAFDRLYNGSDVVVNFFTESIYQVTC